MPKSDSLVTKKHNYQYILLLINAIFMRFIIEINNYGVFSNVLHKKTS